MAALATLPVDCLTVTANRRTTTTSEGSITVASVSLETTPLVSWEAPSELAAEFMFVSSPVVIGRLDITVQGGRPVHLQIDVEREDDGRWLAEIEALPGVMVYGTSRQDALFRVEALALRVLAERVEYGESQQFPSELVFTAV
jgi:predicted RNase H-like HicB family nuclease